MLSSCPFWPSLHPFCIMLHSGCIWSHYCWVATFLRVYRIPPGPEKQFPFGCSPRGYTLRCSIELLIEYSVNQLISKSNSNKLNQLTVIRNNSLSLLNPATSLLLQLPKMDGGGVCLSFQTKAGFFWSIYIISCSNGPLFMFFPILSMLFLKYALHCKVQACLHVMWKKMVHNSCCKDPAHISTVSLPLGGVISPCLATGRISSGLKEGEG